MIKFYRSAIILFLSFALIPFALANGGSHRNMTKKVTAKHKTTKSKQPISYRYLPNFNTIAVQGSRIKLDVISNQRKNKVAVKGPTRGLNIDVKGDTLSISKDKTFIHRKPVSITVWAKRVNTLEVMGGSHLIASKLGKVPVTIVEGNNGDVKVEGIVNLQHVYQEGSGYILAHWVKTRQLELASTGSGRIRLAGVANVLHARLTGNSDLDAPYLRVKTAFVRTRDKATAKVLPLKTLDAFASDHSNIYYFKLPKHFVSATRQYGNVMQLSFWN